MFNLIAKLQKKSEPERRRIALFISLAITGVIVVIWLISLSVRFNDQEPVEPALSPDDTAPLSTIGEQFKGAFDSFKNIFD